MTEPDLGISDLEVSPETLQTLEDSPPSSPVYRPTS